MLEQQELKGAWEILGNKAAREQYDKDAQADAESAKADEGAGLSPSGLALTDAGHVSAEELMGTQELKDTAVKVCCITFEQYEDFGRVTVPREAKGFLLLCPARYSAVGGILQLRRTACLPSCQCQLDCDVPLIHSQGACMQCWSTVAIYTQPPTTPGMSATGLVICGDTSRLHKFGMLACPALKARMLLVGTGLSDRRPARRADWGHARPDVGQGGRPPGKRPRQRPDV